MHDGELTVTAPMVRELVDEQYPQWRELPVKYLEASGTVNAIFRIGEDLAARFPLVGADVEQTRRVLRAEAEAAAELAAHSRVPVPVPVALGEPGAGYPLPWSVQTWLPGVVADEADPGSSTDFANDLADFIQDLRAVDTRGRVFSGRGRGGDLRAHDAWMDTCFERSEGLLDGAVLRRTWAEMRELPRHSPDVMTHGDLIPGNVLVADGR
ncbi:MAG: phosphotransferase, partial [Catenulispora sp.]|nr:phosphotransferase [Catenulispora sp.]